MNEMQQARIDTILELEQALVKSVVDIMKIHGNDPTAVSIILAAYAGSIKKIDTCIPSFSNSMIEMLKGS